MNKITLEIKNLLLSVSLEYGLGEMDFSLEKTQNETFGDYSSNIALVLAKREKINSRKVADSVLEHLIKDKNPNLDISIAGGGFINFKIVCSSLFNNAVDIANCDGSYGESKVGEGKKINIEFVSANPTGPLHIGNARGGPLGDVLANVYKKCGYLVTREYYHNNVGGQMKKLGETVVYYVNKSKGVATEFPEGGYEGGYIEDVYKEYTDLVEQGRSPELIGTNVAERFKDTIIDDCHNMGIEFDKVSKEDEIVAKGYTKKAFDMLKKGGFCKQRDGAWWFAPKDEFLGDRECVLEKSDGQFTYFANDIAYHLGKITLDKDKEDDFVRAIDIWGANHFGHIPRMQAALNALGLAGFLDVILYQWVSLIRNGKEVSMSKRKGNFITAKEVLDEVGKDAFRWFFLEKDANSPIKFDLSLAKEKSNKNPVFYVQYACARINSVLTKMENKNLDVNFQHHDYFQLNLSERSLLRELIYFPDIVEDVCKTCKVQELTNYALRVADKFHKFYEDSPVIGSDREKERVVILKATKIVLESTLALLGISAPKRM
jgi:arginyl-tRNA synthetase